MKKASLFLTAILLTTSLAGCTKAAKTNDNLPSKDNTPKAITISAAASLKEALSEIQPIFEKEKNIKLTFNLGASGTLQKQIEEGAPSDLFISAGKKQMDELESKNLIEKSSRVDLLKNQLVLVVSKEQKDSIKSVQDLNKKDIKISIGEVETVPAGQYAKDSLTYLKLWDLVKDKLVYAKDVKQVLTYVERGEVAAGFVYKSDATNLKDSVIAEVVDEKSHKSIVYPAALISASKEKDSAKAFLDFLKEDKAKAIFIKYGFEI